jgi:hypothetical protein
MAVLLKERLRIRLDSHATAAARSASPDIVIKLPLDVVPVALTKTEQALRVEVRDLLLIIRVDRHLIKELPSGFHAAVWIVRCEQNAVDADRVRHAQIGLVRQTPALMALLNFEWVVRHPPGVSARGHRLEPQPIGPPVAIVAGDA